MSIVPTVSIAHNANGCPMDKIDVQWTQWTSMLRRFMTQLGVTVIFIVICDALFRGSRVTRFVRPTFFL